MNNETVVKDTLLDFTSTVFFNQEEGNFNQLRRNASFFLKKIENLEHKELSMSLKDWAGSFVNNNITRNKDISEIMFFLSTFQTQINLFLGRTIYLTYVCSDGNIKLFDQFETRRIYAHMHPTKDGRGTQYTNDNLRSFQENVGLSINQKIQFSLKNKKRVYTEALRRFRKKPRDYYKTKTNREKFGGMQYKDTPENKNTFYFYLWDTNHIHWGHKTSRGAIGEAYVDAVVNEDESITNADVEWSLLRLDIRLQRENKMNSIGGIIKGDIKLKNQERGDIQFAVKSMGIFSAPSVRQYIAFAYNILLFRNLTKKEVEDNIKDLSNIKGNSLKLLQNIKDYSQDYAKKRIESTNRKIIIKI